MKIINNSVKCDCGIIFTYDDDETEIDEEKEKYVICPRCGKHNFTGEMYKEITIDNVEFPGDFYDFYEGVSIDNKTINKWIKECISNIKESNETTSSIGTGNTLVSVNKYEDCYQIIVSCGYYECEIER